MVRNIMLQFKFKLWIEKDGEHLVGKGGIQLLKKVNEVGSISRACRDLNMSYKFAWEYMKSINQKFGGIEMKKGGRGAGGSIIDERLLKLIEIYDQAMKEINEVIEKYNKKLQEIFVE